MATEGADNIGTIQDFDIQDIADEEREGFLRRVTSTSSLSQEARSSSVAGDPSPRPSLDITPDPLPFPSPDLSPVALKHDRAVQIPSTALHRSGSILGLVFIYAALSIISWVLLCLLTVKPLTARRYGVDADHQHNNGYGYISYLYFHALYVNSEHIFRTTRIIQAVVSVLTIPITSAVCSKAAVIFVQRCRQREDFKVRQLMTLADKGWADPEILWCSTFGWKRYGSSFLLLAILLNLLGAVIAPVQQHFLTQKTLKTPVSPELVESLTDIPDFFNTQGLTAEDNLNTILTRSALTATANSDYQPRLWTEAWSCDPMSQNNTYGGLPSWCQFGGGITLGNLLTLSNPWLAQLPSSYNTGLIKQFLPRFNFTVTKDDVTAGNMPKDCANLPGAFYAHYAKSEAMNGVDSGNWSVEICMPTDQRHTPWKPTRLRQDFTEELYLNISVVGYGFGSQGGMFKITSRTTAGYFELPNYMNGGNAGSLLTGDPSEHCGLDCLPQKAWNGPIYDHNLTYRSVKRTGAVMNESYASLSLDSVLNKGPLLMVTLALFGDTSFIPTRLKHPDAYIYQFPQGRPGRPPLDATCIEQAPFMALLHGDTGLPDSDNHISSCITNAATSEQDVDSQIADYIRAFYYNSIDGYAHERRILNAFTSAVFLATEQKLLNPPGLGGSLTVNYDLGADSQIPVISRLGMIVVSLLLGLDVVCLFAMAIYSALTPRWTDQFDSFAMMRIGAAISEQLPLDVAYKPGRIEVLDKLSGFVGHAVPHEPDIDESSKDDVSKLDLGASFPIARRSKYRCYPTDIE